MSIATKCTCGKSPAYCIGGDGCRWNNNSLPDELLNAPKPIKTKPYFYSCCLKPLQEIAMAHGYNLLIHGSMNRDMDLVAVPWVDEPKPHVEMLDAFAEYLGVPKMRMPDGSPGYDFSILPGGRHSYIINLNRGGRYNNYFDEQYYIDISVTK